MRSSTEKGKASQIRVPIREEDVSERAGGHRPEKRLVERKSRA
jgi:hypothetical protein